MQTAMRQTMYDHVLGYWTLYRAIPEDVNKAHLEEILDAADVEPLAFREAIRQAIDDR